MIITRYTFRNIAVNIRIVFTVLLLYANISASFSQDAPQKATRQSSIDAYSAGNFELAYKQFSELSSIYPKDPVYKYYRGVCLVKLERDPGLAVTLLTDAVRESAAIRPVPADARFFLGRSEQMSGNFSEAIKSYEAFAEQAGKKIAKDMNVPELIRQCEAGKGSIASVSSVKKESTGNVTPVTTVIVAAKAESVNNNELPQDYEKLLSEALIFQKMSDSVMADAVKYRGEMDKAEGNAKSALWIKIREAEKQSEYYSSLAEQKMSEAGKLAGINDSTVQETAIKTDAIKAVVITAAVKDTIKSGEKTSAQQAASLSDTQDVKVADPQPVVKEVFSEFNITEKPVYKPDEKVAVNPEVPPGLIYRIQVAVFRNPVTPSYFKGLTPVHGFRNDVNGITTYYAGMFRKSADAVKVLPRIKALGFKDAYVIALMDKKTVSAERAALLEKEWGSKPLYTVKTGPETVRDTVPQTLVFRVEVKRSPKPLPKDQLEAIKKTAGTRGLDIIVTETKQNVYLIGTFLTYKSASEFSDLLIRNGYRDSKVVAYLGKREIPVETARKLFDEY